ncbi:hypothetical protein DFH08DRAFT_976603 [Mycena albidolilacea]|uniref:Uncharacterized protein n=1 Tax=Mycena albidolilacea TaxID=1033008 RepID=A0AAD6Z2G8_9AGAR|nr:hypothetical protein DFH08DRAFT_976603 [Mycena albidolilacea]
MFGRPADSWVFEPAGDRPQGPRFKIKLLKWDRLWTSSFILQALPFPNNYFSHNLMNFGIQVIPDAALVVKASFCILKSSGELDMTIWTSPGWLDSLKIAIKGITMPPVFTGPLSMKESITSLITAAGFTDINVQPITFEHTDDMGWYLNYMGEVT